MQKHGEHVPYDPDFETPHVVEKKEKEKAAMTFSISLTPKKVFLSGALAGALIMALPLTFFATKATGSSTGGSAVVNGVPSAPAPDPSLPQAGTVKPIAKEDHVLGDRKAPVSLIVYSDIECPFCKRFHPTIQQVAKEYGGKVKIAFRHFPLGFHANAQKEAEATECANELGGNDKFWKYLDTMFERTTSNGTGFPLDGLTPLAKEIGLDEQKFKGCLDSGKYAQHVQQEMQEGSVAGVDGTPGSLLLGKSGKPVLIPGAVPFETLKVEIDKLLK
ncbi:MAG: DsbA family protein [bacterium]|nr:DsbA family protein [bacterium]